MPKAITIIPGQKFNKLTIVKEVARTRPRNRRVLCKCDCGKLCEINFVQLTTSRTLSCGCAQLAAMKKLVGPENPFWKGGRRLIEGGYIEVYAPNHPRARQNGYVKEHRLVMETKLGRLLLFHENVHHLNGDKADNRIENLELWSTSQPSGQRVEDKIKWAKEILTLYNNYEKNNHAARTASIREVDIR